MAININIFSLIQLVVFVIITWNIKYLLKYIYLKYRLRNVPGYAGLPLIGLAYDISKIPNGESRIWFENKLSKFKGNVFVLWLGTRPSIYIQKAKHVQVILSNAINTNKSSEYKLLTPGLGNGLLISAGEQWLHQRRLLTSAFHFGIVNQFVDVMLEKSKKLNEWLEDFVRENPGKPVEIGTFSAKYSLHVICETAMGVEIQLYGKKTNEYIAAVQEFSSLVRLRALNPIYHWDFFYYMTSNGKKFKETTETMHNFTSQVVKAKLEKKRPAVTETQNESDEFGRRKRKAFLDLLIENSDNDEHPLSIDEIREQVDTFMYAGHDTTSLAISWALFVLGNAPDVQDKVQEELISVFGENDDREVTIADLSNLKYLDLVMKEVLRLYPTVAYFYRELSEEIQFDEHKIPKGVTVVINVIDLHRNPEVFERPLEFIPERFLPENSHGRYPYSYIPFSAGPRNCIGQKFAHLEFKVALVAVLRKWRIQSVQKHNDLKLQSDLVLRSFEPIKLHLTPLKKK